VLSTYSLSGAATQALLLSLAVALPVLAIAALVGVIVAAVSAASQVQDPTLSHLPRLLATTVALVALGPWMAYQIAEFAKAMFAQAAL
jgi:flagellar biosynthesis protein FliQ